MACAVRKCRFLSPPSPKKGRNQTREQKWQKKWLFVHAHPSKAKGERMRKKAAFEHRFVHADAAAFLVPLFFVVASLPNAFLSCLELHSQLLQRKNPWLLLTKCRFTRRWRGVRCAYTVWLGCATPGFSPLACEKRARTMPLCCAPSMFAAKEACSPPLVMPNRRGREHSPVLIEKRMFLRCMETAAFG